MQIDSQTPLDDNRSDAGGRSDGPPEHNKLVRLLKTIVYHPDQPGPIDEQVVSSRFYNSFNYSLVANAQHGGNLTIGITSAKEGEGKTLVASNLAALIAMGSQRKTIIVDLNLQSPRIHKIFGAPQSPGLAEALGNGSIQISRTRIENLCMLSSGQKQALPLMINHASKEAGSHLEPSILLSHIAGFRDVIYSLEQEFEFVIVDLPSINAAEFPTVLAHQFNGLLIVMHTGKTKREEIEKIFRNFNHNHVLGFVLNHYNDNLR